MPEPWIIHSYLPGEFAIARPGADNYARHTLVCAHNRKDAEFIINALNTYESLQALKEAPHVQPPAI